MSNADVRYDNDGLEADSIGNPWGISASDRPQGHPRLQEAREAVLAAHRDGSLGFLDLPTRDPSAIVEWADRRRSSERWTDAVVIGIGGSSLGARAVLEATPSLPAEDGLDLHFAENVDPDTFGALLENLPLESTLFVVVTKSGTTVETMSKFAVVFDRLQQRFDADALAEHIVAVTSPETGALRAMVDAYGFDSFSIPPNVGGRFSVLSPVGLVPLALAGYDVASLLDGARRMRSHFVDTPPADNLILRLADDIDRLYERGLGELVMMGYSDHLGGLVDWFRQLWAESLGKAVDRQGRAVHHGMTPVKAIGTVDQHSQVQLYMEGPSDRLVLFVGLESFGRDVEIPEAGLPDALAHLAGHTLSTVMDAELHGTRKALQEVGRPTAHLQLPDLSPAAIGAFFVTWESVTAVIGELWDIDAYNQPGVELGKRIAHRRLGRDSQ